MLLPLETNENTYHAIGSFDSCARGAESAERSYSNKEAALKAPPQLVEKWPVWLHNQTGRKVNEG